MIMIIIARVSGKGTGDATQLHSMPQAGATVSATIIIQAGSVVTHIMQSINVTQTAVTSAILNTNAKKQEHAINWHFHFRQT
mmetsp:Transcript_23457/g.37549  ORF Transcript_23457/g.37549 Transcript_23457/m.37549 type:complete len:82 (+) Transcript_23457:1189-1434(+)